jgi:hypothetical protein
LPLPRYLSAQDATQIFNIHSNTAAESPFPQSLLAPVLVNH